MICTCTCRLNGTAAARGIVSTATGGVRRGWSGGGLADERLAALASSAQAPPRGSHRSQSTTSSPPFYGTPRPPSSRYVAPPDDAEGSSSDEEQRNRHLPPLSPLQRLATLVHSSLTALNDPTRADAVAAVGEVTGSYALSRMRAGMEANGVGRRILTERPVVDEKVAERAFELLQQHTDETSPSSINFHNPINGGRDRGMTFGAAYATFLQTHEFDPNDRSAVRFLSDPDLSYVMTRYRQCHDYWHVLTGLPPTVLGELALKWLELMQTGLPLAALSATGGALGASGLGAREREALWEVYLPWAVRVGGTMKEHSLMCTYYEEELETELGVLRERMGVEAAPIVEL
ncbi:hypothetical protein ACHAXT_002844 [Thalassiosira profunda]